MDTPRSLVTGANRGLGLEFVRQLLARGGQVVATCRHPGKATALNALAGEHPGRLYVLPLDVADPRAIAELARELPLLDHAARLDLLVNCAGVLHSGERFGSVAAATLEDSFRTNAMGPLLLTQALAPWLRDGARVANLSSVLGSIASVNRFGTPSYNLSKAAQNMATALLAQALAPRGIVVLALHPGWAQTAMGGERATVPVADAVAGLLRVIDAAGSDDSGSFRDWRGQPLPW
ncbi:SDR family oxidoreductase [Cognatiluteimonas weifangensis]|uniref:SDR family oxidoreductase n=1 Tax=Cognatiluteimonas weifangensis TaxID=2303539 RepID=A0A372DPM0_9GAMM|nr:SDR family oxidoreductase [Luteimonas weifangensis]RFP61503.1 SDR family oxidoreductase [Luteimonas weifangensis]